MCGISGFISSRLDEKALISMCNRISHRGPDADGFYFDKNVGLGHRRLSIIDLSDAANQPMESADKNWVIIFNGEIYNYKEIKKELEAEGRIFKTSSDTEVVLQAFMHEGVQALKRFVGMFAFAIYNKAEGKLFIVRDRVGVKPLFYYKKNQEFWFASELKAIAALLQTKDIDPAALNDFFRFGYITGERTIYKDVYKLLPGHLIEIDLHSTLTIHQYWDIKYHNTKPSFQKPAEAASKLEELMKNAFNYRMVSDVPVGVFLSGGIDSSTLVALLSQDHSNLQTFSIGFDDEKYNEAPYANKVAKHLGTRHHEKILTAKDAEAVMDKYFDIYDEPFADSSGIPVYLISQFAKDNGCKVVLSADGGDELFGGYSRYKEVPQLYKKLAGNHKLLSAGKFGFPLLKSLGKSYKNISHRVDKLDSLIESANTPFSFNFYENYLSILSANELDGLIDGNSEVAAPHFPECAGQPGEMMMHWDFKNYLPDDLLVKVDRASMATSIEAREPFLDHRLIEFAFSLPIEFRLHPTSSKYLLRQVLYKYVPEAFFERPKMGFSIPLFKWFSEKLDAEFYQLFTKEVLSSIHVLNVDYVLAEYKKYRRFKEKGQEYNMLMMWHLYVFIKWWKRWM